MDHKAIRFSTKFSKFTDQWSPRVVAELNDYQFKLARLQGEFIWHAHEDTDEAFVVLEGTLRIELRDGEVEISAGEMFVVPKEVEHKPSAQEECKVLVIEPRGVVNTGMAGGERTAKNDLWI